MGFEDIWDEFLEKMGYFISFEWVQEVLDFFSESFSSVFDSPIAIIGGMVSIGLTHIILKKLDYTQSLSLGEKLIQFPIFYIFAFIFTYLTIRRVVYN
ncbi:MAG: hypothetical protein QXU39_02495 [Candidatus Pacearchaeota archaeon]